MRWFPLALLLLCPSFTQAEDWTQWLGNRRDGTWNESGILQKFPPGGLKPAWVQPVGSGYAAPVVAEGRVIVVDYRPKPGTTKLEAIERVQCLDERTGKPLWSHEWETHYRRQLQSYATGPRAAPLIENGLVFTIGATGVIHCLELATGKVVWMHDALEAFDASVPTFGVSASPVAWRDMVIFACGGGDGILRALNQRTGAEVWRALPAKYELPYSAPTLMQLAGRTQLVQWDQQFLSGLDPDTGKVLWQVPFTARSNMAIARPMQSGNRVLVSGFYDGSMLVEVADDGAKMIWKNGGAGEQPQQTRSLHAVMTTPIIEGDYFYGTCSYGELRGLKLNDGERIWENKELTRQGRWGSYFWVKNGDRYFVNNDLGELLIMQFGPQGPKLIDRTPLIKPDTHCGYGPRRFADALVNWVQPAYANGHIIIRNDSEIRRVSLQAR
ncbi:MAG: PQQ-like beta-propeller repeat protein [Planctomycetales bacterium]|nr:PQQ-like beta-propeller repeat protein [Planctomycetales bacterium]